MRKFLITTLLATFCATFWAEGQTIATFKESLVQADSLTGAKVVCVEYESAREAVEKFDAQTSPMESLRGYRIRIYSGNHQLARAEAEAAKALFEENYTVPAYFVYDNPYFLVTCGNCLSQEEAMILLRSVRVHFPKAFIVMADIPRGAIVAPPAPPKVSEETLATPTEMPASEGAEKRSDFAPTEPTGVTQLSEI